MSTATAPVAARSAALASGVATTWLDVTMAPVRAGAPPGRSRALLDGPGDGAAAGRRR